MVFRKQLEILRDFINNFDFIKMRPDNSVVKELPDNVTAQVLSEPGRAYALYINGSGLKNLTIEIPPGSYMHEWIDTRVAKMLSAKALTHQGSPLKLPVPEYKDDIALRIKRSD